MGNVNAHCNSSFFLKGVLKIADIDINPFGKHDKTDAQCDTGETIPFTLGGVIEGVLGNQNANKKHHSEVRVSEQKSSKNMSKHCIMCYPKKQVKPQKHSFSIISNT